MTRKVKVEIWIMVYNGSSGHQEKIIVEIDDSLYRKMVSSARSNDQNLNAWGKMMYPKSTKTFIQKATLIK
jgi:hypothetical protein